MLFVTAAEHAAVSALARCSQDAHKMLTSAGGQTDTAHHGAAVAWSKYPVRRGPCVSGRQAPSAVLNDWQSRGSWVQVPSPPLFDAGHYYTGSLTWPTCAAMKDAHRNCWQTLNLSVRP